VEGEIEDESFFKKTLKKETLTGLKEVVVLHPLRNYTK
jgi:hypothetical protein